jgi:F-type H+-transporting ATPase subunit b
MDFLKNLGFDPIMLGAQILNFLIIFYLLKRFLYKPVMDMVKKREDKISQGVKDAEDARLKLEETIEEEKRILTKAQGQAREIIDEARVHAQTLAAEIEASSKLQSEKMLMEAKAQMNQEGLEIEKRLSEKTSIIAMDMLSKSLKGFFSDKEQKSIVAKAIKSMKGSN